MRGVASPALLVAVIVGPGLLSSHSSARADAFEPGLPQPRRVELGIGLSVLTLGDRDLLGRRHDGLLRDDAPARPDAGGAAAGGHPGEAVVIGVRSSAELSRGLFAGVELRGGRAWIRDGRGATTGGDGKGALYYAAGGVLTLALRDGAVAARAEVCVGVRGTAARRSNPRRTQQPWATEAQLMLEPRVAIEIPLASPRYRVGMHLGTDLVRHRDVSAGVHLTIAGRAADGLRLARSLR
jgi:hypothetical protein